MEKQQMMEILRGHGNGASNCRSSLKYEQVHLLVPGARELCSSDQKLLFQGRQSLQAFVLILGFVFTFLSWKFVSIGACETTWCNVEFELVKLQRNKSHSYLPFWFVHLRSKQLACFLRKQFMLGCFQCHNGSCQSSTWTWDLDSCHFSLKQSGGENLPFVMSSSCH